MSNSFVNPLASLDSYKNQKLGAINTGRAAQVQAPAGAGLGVTAQERMQAGKSPLSATTSIDNIQKAASRQHELRLAAMKRKMEQDAQANSQGSYGAHSGSGGPLVGKWNLVSGADKALQGMNAAFYKQFGYNIPINEGGRTRDRQAQLYALWKAGKGNLAAKPGTSKHESGRALDLGGAFQNAGSREHKWLQQNSYRWGYKWTGKNFSQFEPWHWEWMG